MAEHGFVAESRWAEMRMWLSGRCRPYRFVTELPSLCWVLLYTGVFMLALGAWAATGQMIEVSASPLHALVWATASVVWIGPFCAPVVGVCLMVLLAFRETRWYWFRLAALVLCTLPSLLLLGEPELLKSYLPVQIIVALLLIQPLPADADRDPSMDNHHW